MEGIEHGEIEEGVEMTRETDDLMLRAVAEEAKLKAKRDALEKRFSELGLEVNRRFHSK